MTTNKISHQTGFISNASLAVLLIFGSQKALHAETPSTPKSVLSHTLGTFELELNNEDKQCRLQVKSKSTDESKTIPLLLEAPCYWVVSNESKNLLSYSYESIDVDNTLIVAGTLLDWPAEKKAYQKLPENAYCSQFLQGIVVQEDQIYAVKERMVAAHCETGLTIDEKVFYALAHNPERYQEKIPTSPELKTDPAQPKKSAEVKPEDSEEKSFLGLTH